jgi:nucleoside triphosphate pyrophosphatase
MTNSPPLKKIILASASAIRAEIMTNAGLEFSVKLTNLDENNIKNQCHKEKRTAKFLVKKLALAKAGAFTPLANEIIIGADQVLEFEGKVFDKPKSVKQVRSRLMKLRGREHRLVGAVCIIQKDEKPWCHISTTKLQMRDFSDEFLKSYIEEEEALTSCVGAYKFEGRGALLFDKVEGDYFSILGLSLLPLLSELRRRGALVT